MVDIVTERPGSGGGGVAGSSFSDNLFNIFNEADPSKVGWFDCSGIPAGTTPSLKFPAFSGAGVIAALDIAGTWTRLQTYQTEDTGASLIAITYAPATSNDVIGIFDSANGGSIIVFAPAAGLVSNRRHSYLDGSGAYCLIGNDSDPPAAGFMGKVDRTAQTADIASVKLTDTCPAGQYLVVGELECTTGAGGAGTVTITFSWTNDSGARTSAVTLSLATAGSTPILIPVYLASGDVSWAVTHAGLYLTSQYALRARTVALG